MDNIELLFFDTFSHDISEELNLDLVQFPKPVYITEVRIIPLGARVQADFPGGVRLGATNPSQFEIEFFVNDLSKPGASTFESLGGLEYKQNVHIQLECERKQIPTDGLVLRGWYTTITLAVYGSLTKSLTNPPEARPAAPVTPVPPAIAVKSEPAVVVNAPLPAIDIQPEWYFESQSQAHPALPPETCPTTTPSPIVQPIQTIESSQKSATFDLPISEAPQWTDEPVEPPSPQKTPKRPSSPPPESLVSLSPEPISAEEEDGEKEPEEPLQADPVEPFEPILSDEELMTDDMPAPTADFPCDTLPKDLYPLEPPDLLDIEMLPLSVVEDDENTEKIRETLKFLAKSVVNFNNVTGQEKETFVHNCESLCVFLGSIFHCDKDELQYMSDVVNVGLDIELARAQPQPGYKVRHVKVGVRLAEAVCNLPQGDDILLKIDAPTKLLSLCMQENVALPVKLAALRALDAALASPKVVEKFLMSPDLYQINLYRLTLVMLDEAKLARLKYALASLLRKIHVYELLAKCRTDGLTEMVLGQLMQTFACAATLMAQPKRQLPASMQMEFEREPGRNPRRHLIFYFEHHNLLQQLLYILTSSESSENLIRIARAFITRLTNTGEGLIYLLKNPDVTKPLLKALRYHRPGLGTDIAWKLQVMQCLMQIKHQNAVQALNWHTIRRLHYYLTYEEGLRAIIAVLSIGSYLEILIPLLAHRDLAEFVAEVISAVIRYSDRVKVFRRCATVLLQEARCSQNTLRDVTAFLTIMAAESNWNYGDVSSLVAVIRKNAEKASSLPGELIAACRILYYLIFPPNDDLDPMEPYVELRHRNALTQFFSADGLTALIAVISNLTTFYHQPFLHRAAFTGRRGLALIGLLLPCIKLLRALLERLVKCMTTEFKDLTPVVPLLSLYALIDTMPPSKAVWRIAKEIAETLLLFTRAVDSDGAGNVAKSLWTQMLGEVLKMISANPCNFVPGLKLLARLLPPILHLDDHVDAEDITRIMGLRKLWSAHLQAQAVNLTDTLRLLCASWNETLLTLLSAVCKQLSDLAAPTALLVGRCLLDQVLAACPLENHAPTLALLGDLTLHGPLKATLLTLMSPTARSQAKVDQKYLPVVEMMCTVLKNTNDLNVQTEILDIFYTLCDHTLSIIVQENNSEPFELWLTHSVPSKEPLLSIISALIDIFANASKYSLSSLESTLQILLSLAEHNYGLYHVKTCLENNLGALKAFIEHIAMLVNREGETEEKINTIMMLTVAFLESLITCSKFGKRTLYLRLSQLATIIVWEKSESHPLEKIKGSQDLVSDLKAMMDSEEKEPIPEMLEPLLPVPETLLNQFAQRSVKGSRCSPSRTRKRPLSNAIITSDSNIVDLIALATELLPADFNLLTATQLLCSKARKDEIVEPVPVKGPASSTKDIPKPPPGLRKPPFVTPMRGRAQFVSSRGGLVAGGVGRGADPFRSRPPNTSRPPSLHVDDFVALETCGAQPTGPTGYNKLSVRGVCPPRGVISGSRCRPWGSEPRPPYLR